MNRNTLFIFAAALAVGLFLFPPPHTAVAAPGVGFVDSFSVTCGTTATVIQADNQVSYMCEVDEAAGASVFIGDAAVTASTGVEYKPAEDFGGNVKFEYCIVAAGTETVNCRAQVTRVP